MRIFVCDAFSSEIFKGNQAGVVILEENVDYPNETLMKNITGELKHSETAFVKRIDNKKFKIRYFTPIEEVELCGHATISVFSVLRELKLISSGKYIAETLAGNLEIGVDKDFIWMDMASPKIEYTFNLDEIKEIYSAFNLNIDQASKNLIPKIVNTGLSDIIIPIENKETLDSFVMNKEKVIELSKKYKVVGAHLFTLDKNKKVTAFCRNIAPLVGIDEECATGTSNGALTHYLKDYNIISIKDINTFIQGEAMGRSSTVLSRYKEDEITIQVGGNAVISFECKIYK
ncbi:PhzF family phenazine biosynthesis protein [Fusobacterium canifelinum]|uniref:PhzF family phenazine biosynthesis protein n=1 Tax=Fusobacterium canifelinum TaxID=285729 RepID=A0A7T4FNT1_9FUSO|nr:PhzF family phenazine biosynthesis protein [Fusobacterium canifelinum]QQB73881.1 PhzF family phenazine biosynthesis protein [Fusobacterium canifelinum]